MIKIQADTLETAYRDAASHLECSVTQLKIEVVQAPRKGFLGLFAKPAIIVAVKEVQANVSDKREEIPVTRKKQVRQEAKVQDTREEKTTKIEKSTAQEEKPRKVKAKKPKHKKTKAKEQTQRIVNDTIMPASFVSMQDEDEEDYDVSNYLADYEDDEEVQDVQSIQSIAKTVQKEINQLFALTCFSIEAIDVSAHDESTLLIEFTGDDAALLIGKEGYRYKALSYMIFNWINTKYQLQLRLEIAEFLKNQEEAVRKYLVGVCENINKDGRAQTKILDGVLVQIALNELRDRYPDKYVVIRSTRDGLKYIIVNDYHNN